ncbi:MAG: MFS transporter, partial [Proteobacteria bacterium]
MCAGIQALSLPCRFSILAYLGGCILRAQGGRPSGNYGPCEDIKRCLGTDRAVHALVVDRSFATRNQYVAHAGCRRNPQAPGQHCRRHPNLCRSDACARRLHRRSLHSLTKADIGPEGAVADRRSDLSQGMANPNRSETRVQSGRASSYAGEPTGRRSSVFVWLYALAWGGGVVAYAPFLTLVLPLRVEALAPDFKVAMLSLIALVGALVASVVNILVGVLSDRSVGSVRGRRPWVALGLGLTLASYALLPFCSTPTTLLAGVILFQVALNTMLGPLGAIAADETPDSQKGFISGAMGAGGALGVVAGVIVTAWP